LHNFACILSRPLVDRNLITARNPGDIPEFAPKVVEMFAAASKAIV